MMSPFILALLIITGGTVAVTLIGCLFVFVVSPMMTERRQRLKMDEKMLTGSMSDVDIQVEFAKLHTEINEIKRMLQGQLAQGSSAPMLPSESAMERERAKQIQQ